MKKNILWSAKVAVLAAACAAVPMLASARGAGAFLGGPALGSSSSCFNESRGGVTNTCTTRQDWIIPSINDSSGSQTFQVRVHGVAGTPRIVRCQAFSVDSNQGSMVMSPVVSSTQHTGATENLPLSVGVHGFGATWARCGLDQHTVLHNAHY